jgi:hypothetical protein
MWTAGMWHLYHGNSLAHTVLSLQEFLAKNLIPVLPQSKNDSERKKISNGRGHNYKYDK